VWPFSPKKIASKFALEVLDRARERRLSDVALFSGPREIEVSGDRQEVSDLMHFHRNPLPEE
jgi:hypothetical protein